MSLAVEAHKAVHDALAPTSSPLTATEAALTALISRRVYDKVPGPAPTYPYIVVDIDVRDDATTCALSREVHPTVHIWSNQPGSIQAKTIGAYVTELLAPLDPDDAPAIEGYLVHAADLDAEIYRDGGDTLLTEGVLTFTYLVDPETE